MKKNSTNQEEYVSKAQGGKQKAVGDYGKYDSNKAYEYERQYNVLFTDSFRSSARETCLAVIHTNLDNGSGGTPMRPGSDTQEAPAIYMMHFY